MSWMKHTCIVGLPRTGKTTFAKNLFFELPENHIAIFVNSQWEDYFQGIESEYKYPFPQLKNKIVFNIYDFGDLFKLLKDIFEAQKQSVELQPITIFIDEAHKFFPRYMNIQAPENQIVNDIFTLGLKWNIRLVIITQKPQMLCTDLYTLCERMIVFKLHQKDIEYF
ncbi:MAG: ATP-binding protein, partial [Candidatus Thermoplasmatota archaeon]